MGNLISSKKKPSKSKKTSTKGRKKSSKPKKMPKVKSHLKKKWRIYQIQMISTQKNS